jgi:hypothetical protein
MELFDDLVFDSFGLGLVKLLSSDMRSLRNSVEFFLVESLDILNSFISGLLDALSSLVDGMGHLLDVVTFIFLELLQVLVLLHKEELLVDGLLDAL